MSKRAASIEELFPLMEACRAGDLEFVGAWIRAGKPLDPPEGKKSRRRSPLQVAIEKGFLTLAKTLLNAGADPLANGNALEFAVDCGRVDLARLLLEQGVGIGSVSFTQVCYGANPAMIRLFLDRGADAVTDDPLYHGLTSTVRPLLGIYKEYHDRFPDWQRQLNRALVHHVQQGSPQNVALLLWAGAQPDVAAPQSDQPDGEETALEVAAAAGNLEILKALKPAKYPQSLGKVLRSAWLQGSIPMIDYLLELGAPLNDKADGGSDLLDSLIRTRLDDWPGGASRSEDALQVIEHVCKRGAKWVFTGDQAVRDARYSLRRIPSDRVYRLIKILLENKTAAPEFIEPVIATPGFQARLGTYAQTVRNLLHPPIPRKPRASAAPGEDQPATPLPLPEVRARAERWMLERIVRQGRPHFSRVGFSESFTPSELRSPLGIRKDDERDPHAVIEGVCTSLNRKLTSLQFAYEPVNDGWRRTLAIRLAAAAEWPDVFREISHLLGTDSRYWLSSQAAKLLRLVEGGELGADFVAERQVSAKIGLGRYLALEPYLLELERETNGSFRFEAQGEGSGPHTYRFSWQPTPAGHSPISIGVNPECKARWHSISKSDFDEFRVLVYEKLCAAKPTGSQPVSIYRLATRRELLRCFPGLPLDDRNNLGTRLAEFFRGVMLNPALRRSYDFQDHAPVWHFTLHPTAEWESVLKAIEEEMRGPTLEMRYGLLPDAARLLEWLERLDPKRLQGAWTPPVEDCNTREIGLQQTGGEENLPFYLQILTDDINEKTPYRVTLFSWREYARQKTRLKLAKKTSDLDGVVRQIQWLGLQHGQLLQEERVRATLKALLQD